MMMTMLSRTRGERGRRRPHAIGAVPRLGRALGAALLLMAAGLAAAVEVGQPAPAFALDDIQGERRALADLKGQVVVLEWVNFECPYTRKHYDSGNMQTLQKEAEDAGAIWLSVISSAPGEQGHLTPGQAEAALAREGAAPGAMLLDEDGTLGRLYDAKTTPHMFIIDGNGQLAYMGGIDSLATAKAADVPRAEPWFRDALLAVTRGETPSRAVTRPYGCSVKYAR